MYLREDEMEMRFTFDKLLKENEEKGGSSKETSILKRRLARALSIFGDEIPYLSFRPEIKEFEWLQETTVQELIKIEEQLYLYGYDAGTGIFEQASRDLFQTEKNVLLELEQDQSIFVETFRHQYLLPHGEAVLNESAEVFQEFGIPFTRPTFDTTYGVIYSNTVYKLYTYLYENAPKENKRKIQSMLQKRGITTKDLKRNSHVNSKRENFSVYNS